MVQDTDDLTEHTHTWTECPAAWEGHLVLTVAQVLEVPVVRSATPSLLTPAATAARAVRWVHTSEIYDIGPLLRGQELLLTTGLGLVGQSPERLRRYVDSLADRDVAGLCLELGRTFDQVPPPIVERAGERGLAVVALGAVVPFVAITEAVHELLLGSQVATLRTTGRLVDRLARAMVDGAGLDALLDEIAAACGSPVCLTDSSGAVVAESVGASGTEPAVQDIVIAGETWGQLCSTAGHEAGRGAHRDPGQPETREMLARAAMLLAVQVARSEASLGTRAIARRLFGRALLAGPAGDPQVVADTGRRLGLSDGPGRSLVPCAVEIVHADLPANVLLVEEAARREFPAAVAVDLPGAVLVIAAVPRGVAPERVGERVAALAADAIGRRGSGFVRCVVVGEPVDRLAALPAQAGDVVSGIALVPLSSPAVGPDRPGSSVDSRGMPGARRVPIVQVRDLALEHYLATGVDSVELTRFVDRQLGAVLDYDARHRRGLLPTLTAYLESGGNKLATAAALGIQRQTLYDRLDKLTELLRADPARPATRTALHVAVVAYRLRSGAARFPTSRSPAE